MVAGRGAGGYLEAREAQELEQPREAEELEGLRAPEVDLARREDARHSRPSTTRVTLSIFDAVQKHVS